ncbi:hypothetical protein MPH_05383 [Macrophomina phaseolina MS6]|uniref:Uncharacterized protein n=1 Tax=Macrophomina phaseolina (strain MS6) TaxID=1126212 RepID=K2RX59_MACPH|nr:hypothetical protein MPH_05383 [Macrophomina phaseolina MS6]
MSWLIRETAVRTLLWTASKRSMAAMRRATNACISRSRVAKSYSLTEEAARAAASHANVSPSIEVDIVTWFEVEKMEINKTGRMNERRVVQMRFPCCCRYECQLRDAGVVVVGEQEQARKDARSN